MARSKTASFPGRIHPSLPNVLDAYETFCHYGSMRLSWRNLSLYLTHYLRDYFQFKDRILPPRKEGERPEFLARLRDSEFGYVLSDVVYLLFRQTPALFVDAGLVPWRFRQVELNTASSNGPLLDLSERKLHDLLLDVTIELDSRTQPGKDTTVLTQSTAGWSPTQQRFNDPSFYTAELLPKEPTPFEIIQKASFLKVGNLLRRALSIGSRPIPRSPDWRVVGRPVTLHQSVDSSVSDTSGLALVALEDDPAILATHDEGMKTPDVRVLEADSPQGSKMSSSDRSPLVVLQEEDSKTIHTSRTLESLIEVYGRTPSASISSSQVTFARTRDLIEVCKGHWLDTADTVSIETFQEDPISSISISSAYGSFITAQSRLSVTVSDFTASSRPGSIATFISITTATVEHPSLHYGSYQKLLQEQDLLPEHMMETDWSGRGQHAQYAEHERDHIPLQTETTLGRTRNALVESVRCRRVRLVRKTMRCTKWSGLKREDVVREVQHLYRVQHSHIVRLVGTYAIGPDVAILTYPCAEWNLSDFMRTAPTAEDVNSRSKSLRQFFTCLSKVLDFMHSFPLKHMDIKPANLLVRDIRHSSINDSDPFKIYFTDFGISRSYPSIEDCETETPTSFTRTYAALEVVLQESRGLPADVFSLGCVFAEMLATILDCSASQTPDLESTRPSHVSALHTARTTSGLGLRSYHAAVQDVRAWLAALPLSDQPELSAVAQWIEQMLDPVPEKRPSARQISEDPHLPFACLSCVVRTGVEEFEVAGDIGGDLRVS